MADWTLNAAPFLVNKKFLHNGRVACFVLGPILCCDVFVRTIHILNFNWDECSVFVLVQAFVHSIKHRAKKLIGILLRLSCKRVVQFSTLEFKSGRADGSGGLCVKFTHHKRKRGDESIRGIEEVGVERVVQKIATEQRLGETLRHCVEIAGIAEIDETATRLSPWLALWVVPRAVLHCRRCTISGWSDGSAGCGDWYGGN